MPDVLHPEGGPDDDESDEQGLPDGDFVEAGTAGNRLEADLLIAACEDAGIIAIVRAPRDSMVGKLDAPTESLQILVREADLARARPLLAERRAALLADEEAAGRAAEEAELAEEAQAAAPPPGDRH